MKLLPIQTMVLLSLITFVLGLPLPMYINSKEEQGVPMLDQASERVSSPASSSNIFQRPLIALPQTIAYESPDDQSWLPKQTKKLKKSLSFSGKMKSDSAMERMLNDRSSHARIDESVDTLTREPTKISGLQAIQLPEDRAYGSQALAVMTSREKSFLAVDKRGRVWFFNAKRDPTGKVYFTYNGNLKEGHDDSIRQAVMNSATKNTGAARRLSFEELRYIRGP